MTVWMEMFTDRQRKLIDHARQYVKDPFGVDGHNSLVTIAQMADLLDRCNTDQSTKEKDYADTGRG